MILVGQYDSPFVRRVAVTMNFYDMVFERRVLSVFTDFDVMLAVNPLGKVPVLQLTMESFFTIAARFSTTWTAWLGRISAWCQRTSRIGAVCCVSRRFLSGSPKSSTNASSSLPAAILRSAMPR